MSAKIKRLVPQSVKAKDTVKSKAQDKTRLLCSGTCLFSSYCFIFASSFSVSLLGLLLAYSPTLKIPFSWIPVWIRALTSSVSIDGEEIPDTLQLQPWKDFQFNTNKPKHQQKSEAIFQVLLMCSWVSAAAGDKCDLLSTTPLPAQQGKAWRCLHPVMHILQILPSVLGATVWLPVRRELQGFASSLA